MNKRNHGIGYSLIWTEQTKRWIITNIAKSFSKKDSPNLRYQTFLTFTIIEFPRCICAGFRRVDANQDILRSDRIVSGVPVVRLLTIQAGDDIQRDTGHGGVREPGRFANHVSNNGM